MRLITIIALLLLLNVFTVNADELDSIPDSTKTSNVDTLTTNATGVPVINPAFSREHLLINSYNPQKSSFDLKKFEIYQSFTIGFSRSSWGSHSSGVYLSTIAYNFDLPATLYMDVGAYNLFYASSNDAAWLFPEVANKPEFILPQIGLELRPTENLRINLSLVNTEDAYKAYGYGSRFWNVFDGAANIFLSGYAREQACKDKYKSRHLGYAYKCSRY